MQNIIDIQQDLLSFNNNDLELLAKFYGINDYSNPVDKAWAIAILQFSKNKMAKMGGAVMPLNTHRNINELLIIVNKYLQNRNIIVRFSNNNDKQNILNIMKETEDCHDQTESLITDNDSFTILAIDKNTNNVISYLTWNIEKYKYSYIYISYTCTVSKYRRTGLSTLLRLFPIQMGIDKRIDFIVSDTNKYSKKLLVEKFGFKHSYPMNFWQEIGEDSGWIINVNTKLDLRKSGSLDKFYEIVDKLRV